MPLYLVRFVQMHESFRKAELEALAELAGVEIEFVSYQKDSPFCIVSLPSDAAACTIISRAIISHAIYELWGQGTDYPSLHTSVKETSSHLWAQYATTPFRFAIDSFQGHVPNAAQTKLIESFSYLSFRGPIRMRDAPLHLRIFEHYPFGSPTPSHLYLGRFLASSGRAAKTTYDLKQRHYISTTSMDAELALVTANMGLAAPGKLFYDPFMGTGGFPLACAHFGASVWGSDIDGRTLRGTAGVSSIQAKREYEAGKGIKRDVLGNFRQYGLLGNYLGGIVSDITNSPLRGCGAGGAGQGGKEQGAWLDGIVCDPPYGVREGLRVLGTREKLTDQERDTHADRYKEAAYIPPKRPYSFTALLADILAFASDTLVENGRLSMWMPTANDEDYDLAIPSHPSLQIVSVCVQPFSKWSRRLLTYRRLPRTEVTGNGEESMDAVKKNENGEEVYVRPRADDLNDFRRKYFQGFREGQQKDTQQTSSCPKPEESTQTI
ncbi:tRNA guanosine-2'-O-methyltransferase [Delitschia confertaspora ATCC 74209]|uniref:tRNA (guanine(10)-N(2))-methyltransferase n=1 Tax=Delitschia confertaspora ATCC 74209 TaxID=1513339 RepID=A0A9P4JSA5_9PLEO|nr:tRNA guanosine-2'-O-methyltransferase [Delitschia confertaspora ATCC 74209]